MTEPYFPYPRSGNREGKYEGGILYPRSGNRERMTPCSVVSVSIEAVCHPLPGQTNLHLPSQVILYEAVRCLTTVRLTSLLTSRASLPSLKRGQILPSSVQEYRLVCGTNTSLALFLSEETLKRNDSLFGRLRLYRGCFTFSCSILYGY